MIKFQRIVKPTQFADGALYVGTKGWKITVFGHSYGRWRWMMEDVPDGWIKSSVPGICWKPREV